MYSDLSHIRFTFSDLHRFYVIVDDLGFKSYEFFRNVLSLHKLGFTSAINKQVSIAFGLQSLCISSASPQAKSEHIIFCHNNIEYITLKNYEYNPYYCHCSCGINCPLPC